MRHCSTNRLLPMIQKNLMVLTIRDCFPVLSRHQYLQSLSSHASIYQRFSLCFIYPSQFTHPNCMSQFFFYLVTVAQKSQSFTDIIALLHVLYIPQKNRYSLMSFETQVDVIDQALILANFSQLELTFLGLNFFCQNLIKVKL